MPLRQASSPYSGVLLALAPRVVLLPLIRRERSRMMIGVGPRPDIAFHLVLLRRNSFLIQFRFSSELDRRRSLLVHDFRPPI